MRSIRVGDKVQAFLDVRIKGTVLEILTEKKHGWLVGGTTQQERICVLELLDGRKMKCKMHELHHVYD